MKEMRRALSRSPSCVMNEMISRARFSPSCAKEAEPVCSSLHAESK